MGGDIYFPYSPEKSVFLKSASLVVGDSKAWLGVNETPKELSFGNGVIQGDLVTGNTVLFDNIEWLVCETDYDKGLAYLASYDIVQRVPFDSTNTNYPDSNLRRVAKEFEDNMSPEALSKMVDVTACGVTAKVFIPDLFQMDSIHGGFSYFNSNDRRICNFNRSPCIYWTTTPCFITDYPYFIHNIDVDGGLSSLNSEPQYYKKAECYSFQGFRPFICVKINLDQELYTYDITIKTKEGNMLTNTDIYDMYDNKLGTTNSNGNIKFSYLANKVSIKTKTAQNGYYVNNTITGNSNNIEITAMSIYSGRLGLGNIIHLCNNDWQVCHIEDNKYYLGATTILEQTTFGSSINYKGSTLASRARAYQNTLSSQYSDIVSNNLSNVTVNEVTAKVFVPDITQLDRDLQLGDKYKTFAIYDSREYSPKCTFNGKYDKYWSSRNYDYDEAYSIHESGSDNRNKITDTIGFRPFICFTPQCKYDITIKDRNGIVIPNIDVYDGDDVKLGTTNINGNIKFNYADDHVIIATKTTHDGYYVNEIITGNPGESTVKTVISTHPYGGVLRLGNIINVCNRDWIVCDIVYPSRHNGNYMDVGKYYLAATTILEETKFGSNSTYKGSTLASRAVAYQNTLSSQYPDIVNNYLSDVTVYDVTAKVFAASSNQMNGSFDYFKNNRNRICTYNGQPDWYWTSTNTIWNDDTKVNIVTPQGEVSRYTSDVPSGNIRNTYGFRPFICLAP